jgi:SAM-dependent methyltransferase
MHALETWLDDLRAYVEQIAPELSPMVAVYSAEARFGRQYIARDIANLPAGAAILEVGAGSMLLSCQLVREGFEVTALEPTGYGFAHFDRMRELVLARAKEQNCVPHVLDSTAEALSLSEQFDYGFSVNVMEHVSEIELSIANVGRSLKPGAVYRFTCPNYLFPYEPHFNIPTFFSKRFTERILHRKIHSHPTMPDPSGVWQSLNWIDVSQIRREVEKNPDLQVIFNKKMLPSTLERALVDEEFKRRRSPWMVTLITLLVNSGIHRATQYIPAVLQPIIDCEITKSPTIGTN